MPYSYLLLPGDGTKTNFDFNFGYLAKAHIHVSVDTVETTYTWLTDFSLQVIPAPLPYWSCIWRRNESSSLAHRVAGKP